MQRGFAQPLLIFVLAVAIIGVGGSAIFFKNSNKILQTPNWVTPKQEPKIYINQDLSFEFKYEEGLNVVAESQEEFNQRGGGNFRKNFTSYVQYEPGKFLGAVVVLGEDNSYETNPFTVWVFDNPQELSIEKWYKNYWYYPFVWGDFTSKGKIELAPKTEATISGVLAKSGTIDYQPGKPKFIYIPYNKKMFLFRVVGQEGNLILESFKFINRTSDDLLSKPCAQVITPAKNPQTGLCQTFTSSCIPEGWVVDRVNCKIDL